MIASNGRTGRVVPPIVEIGFYVMLLVSLIFAAFFCVNFFSKGKQATKKSVENQMKKYIEPAEKELKEMDQEVQTPVQPPAYIPPAPVAQPTYTPPQPQYSRPVPQPMMSYQAPAPQNTAPQYDGPFRPTSVMGAGSY